MTKFSHVISIRVYTLSAATCRRARRVFEHISSVAYRRISDTPNAQVVSDGSAPAVVKLPQVRMAVHLNAEDLKHKTLPKDCLQSCFGELALVAWRIKWPTRANISIACSHCSSSVEIARRNQYIYQTKETERNDFILQTYFSGELLYGILLSDQAWLGK